MQAPMKNAPVSPGNRNLAIAVDKIQVIPPTIFMTSYQNIELFLSKRN
jgi:hypothetical protein